MAPGDRLHGWGHGEGAGGGGWAQLRRGPQAPGRVRDEKQKGLGSDQGARNALESGLGRVLAQGKKGRVRGHCDGSTGLALRQQGLSSQFWTPECEPSVLGPTQATPSLNSILSSGASRLLPAGSRAAAASRQPYTQA